MKTLNMTVNINEYYEDGKFSYQWSMYDGPDGIDYFYGECESLESCLGEITKTRNLNLLSYR